MAWYALDYYRKAWNVARTNPWVMLYLFVTVLLGLIKALFSLWMDSVNASPYARVLLPLVFTFIALPATAYLFIVSTRFVRRGQKVGIRQADCTAPGAKTLLSVIAVEMLTTLMALVLILPVAGNYGFRINESIASYWCLLALFIIMVVIAYVFLAYKLLFAQYFAALDDAMPMGAMAESWRFTKGRFVEILNAYLPYGLVLFALSLTTVIASYWLSDDVLLLLDNALVVVAALAGGIFRLALVPFMLEEEQKRKRALEKSAYGSPPPPMTSS